MKNYKHIKSITVVFYTAGLFFSCGDNYKRVGEEAGELIYPKGIGRNFTYTYTEITKPSESKQIDSSRVIAILESPLRKDFENLKFPYQAFPESLLVRFYDKDKNESIMTADYGIIYSNTNLIDLQGNVVIETYDGKKLTTPQLYYDIINKWVFTQEKFTFTDLEEGSVMYGEGMDFSKDLSFLKAHKTYGEGIVGNKKEE